MSDWHECPNAQECTEGNRFGRGCVADPVQSAMGGKPWHECHCGVDSDGNPPNVRQAYTIDALRAENERLRVKSIQMQAALGYGILAEDERHIIPSNPFKCGICDANKHLRAENEKLRAALERIADTDPDDGTAWFHNVARAALEEKS